jgi:uncharacterized membrane protein YedE/YeeE
MKHLIAWLSGFIFGIGLIVSGMTQPAKVIGFLDITGNWQMDLMGVMGGALIVHALTRLWILNREKPLFATSFPTFKSDIDQKLVIGAAIFGLGWGMAGFCPGPALSSLGATFSLLVSNTPVVDHQISTVFYFVGAMIVGAWLAKKLQSQNII